MFDGNPTVLNADLAGFGVSVSAGMPLYLSGGDGDPLYFHTDPSAGDLVFNFSAPISSLTVNYAGNSGNATGMHALNVNTTAADVLSLPGGDSVDYAFSATDNSISLSVNGSSILSAWIEDEGTIVGLHSISFVTEPTPEPATMDLLGLGAFVAVARSRRAAK